MKNRFYCVLAIAIASGLLASTASAGLIGHYRLDDGSGTTAADSAAGPLNGTLTGDASTGGSKDGNGVFDVPSWVAGHNGGALQFGDFYTNSTTFGDKIDDVVEVAGSGAGSKYDITGAITISTWVNLSSNSASGRKSTRHIAGRDQAGGQEGDVYSLKHTMSGSADLVQFLIDDDTLGNVNLSSSSTLSSFQSASTNNGWVHIVGVYSPDNFMRLYIDGQLDAEFTEAVDGVPASIDATDNGSTPFNIGRLHASDEHSFYGDIDDVQVYDQALSGTQVALLFANAGTAIPEPGSCVLLAGLAGSLACARKRRD